MPPVMAAALPGGKGLHPKNRKSRKSVLVSHHSEGTKDIPPFRGVSLVPCPGHKGQMPICPLCPSCPQLPKVGASAKCHNPPLKGGYGTYGTNSA